MDRNTALTAALALLAVVALALSAATLDTATVSSDGGGGGLAPVDGPESGGVGGSPPGVPMSGGEDGRLWFPCIPELADPAIALGIVAAFGLGLALLYWRVRTFVLPAAAAVAFGVPIVLAYALLTACAAPGAGTEPLSLGDGPGETPLPAGGGEGLGPAGEVASTPSIALGLVLLVALLGSVLLLFVSTGDADGGGDEPEAESDPDVDPAAIGRAAGAAADRIEGDADVENEVYRAWAEMTDSLDVARPRSSTPREFASAAVDAGMARADVDELTALFESVRYGGASATAERERRAVDALRRIEEAYAGDDA
ncbi:DUF4129 domain-containing protein [Halegenticoccus tardaugens]|uniref:DUF4129 domain-containing protein n=1 Tax=Halegenticoccus tardaugens TaxID=2071624 RepID=UPI00100C19F8|nr:DUF4129 domain-containing protein [Halegenticoccus tardaugens]